MGTQPTRELEAALAEMAMTNTTLDKVQEEFRYWRAHSRKITLELVTEHGVSVAKASQLSGHTRQTIKIWLDVHNAEQKGRRDAKR